MTCRVIWLPQAMTAYRRLRAADPDGAKQVTSAVRSLTEEPAPQDSTALGRTGFRRLRHGDYRILYEVDSIDTTISVLHVGRLPPHRR